MGPAAVGDPVADQGTRCGRNQAAARGREEFSAADRAHRRDRHAGARLARPPRNPRAPRGGAHTRAVVSLTEYATDPRQ
jgi:hypothetical protein